MYFALVHSVLQYGVKIYANTKPSYFQDLKLINSRILQTLQFKSIRTRLSELYSAYNTLPVSALHEYKISLIIHKFLHNRDSLPESFQMYFNQIRPFASIILAIAQIYILTILTHNLVKENCTIMQLLFGT